MKEAMSLRYIYEMTTIPVPNVYCDFERTRNSHIFFLLPFSGFPILLSPVFASRSSIRRYERNNQHHIVKSKMSVGKPRNIGFEEEKPPLYSWHNPGHEPSELLDETKVSFVQISIIFSYSLLAFYLFLFFILKLKRYFYHLSAFT